MREIVLDTETTGFEPGQGDRIVEIGAVELWDRVRIGETWHTYINPGRPMPAEAFGVHGIGPDLLEPPRTAKPGQVTLGDKPAFERIGQDFLDFIGESRLVIHNAEFDIGFLNAELRRMDQPGIPLKQAIDTLAMAREKFPGRPASLDALCRRFDIDNSARTLHGALLDARILADVYLELTGGRQPDLGLSQYVTATRVATDSENSWRPSARPVPLPPRITKDEIAAHSDFISAFPILPAWKEFYQEIG